MGKTQKGKQISNFLRMKDKEKIIDCFEYNQKEKILLSTFSGKMLQVLSDDLYTIKKSGKKIMVGTEMILAKASLNQKTIHLW